MAAHVAPRIAQRNKPVIPASGLPTATVVDTPLTTLDSLGRGDATFKLTTYSPGPSALVGQRMTFAAWVYTSATNLTGGGSAPLDIIFREPSALGVPPAPDMLRRPMSKRTLLAVATALSGLSVLLVSTQNAAKSEAPRAFIDGTGEGWRDLTEKEFTHVNCKKDTFTWKKGVVYCTGKPTGVVRTKEQFTNFELSLEWRHMKDAGNSGVFVWAIPASIRKLEGGKGRLPEGIEVQVLDLGYTARYAASARPTGSRVTATCFPLARRR